VLSLETDLVSSYALTVFLCSSVVGIGFVTLELWRTRIIRVRHRSAARAIGALIIISCVIYILFRLSPALDGEWIGKAAKWIAGLLGIALVLYVAIDTLRRRRTPTSVGVRWYAYLIPLIPLFLILVFDVAFLAAFLSGLAYGVLATYRRGMLNLTTRSIIEGSSSVIPAVVLMVGIGMLLSAILGPTATGPGKYWHDQQTVSQSLQTESPSGLNQYQKEWPVLADMKPLLSAIVPGSFLAYVLTFALLGPLALDGGPVNVWGLGYGVGGILLATGMPAGAVMGILLSMGMIQGVSDPTNTANVWIANEVRLDVNTIMWRTLPYSWLAAILGLIIAGFRFVL